MSFFVRGIVQQVRGRESVWLEYLVTWRNSKKRGTRCAYHDPHIPKLQHMEHHEELEGVESIQLSADAIKAFDAVLIITNHDDFDLVAENSDLIIDTRNAVKKPKNPAHIIRA